MRGAIHLCGDGRVDRGDTQPAGGDRQGWIIAHFDDDDYYAPNYLETMIEPIRQGHDLVKLSRWFLYSGLYRLLGYWDCLQITGLHQIWSNRPPSLATFGPGEADSLRNNYLGYGFSYVYRRKVWEAIRFPDVEWNEDGLFAARVKDRFRLHHFPEHSRACACTYFTRATPADASRSTSCRSS